MGVHYTPSVYIPGALGWVWVNPVIVTRLVVPDHKIRVMETSGKA